MGFGFGGRLGVRLGDRLGVRLGVGVTGKNDLTAIKPMR